MLVTIRKAHHFVFNGRAVTRADPFDHTGIHRAAIEVIADHFMGFFIGVRDMARHLFRMLIRTAHEGEYRHRVVTELWCQLSKIDGPGVNTRRCSCFQTADTQRQFPQTV